MYDLADHIVDHAILGIVAGGGGGSLSGSGTANRLALWSSSSALAASSLATDDAVNFTVQAADDPVDGGDVTLTGGAVLTNTAAYMQVVSATILDGGHIIVLGGSGLETAADGGTVLLSGGAADTGEGGSVNVTGGAALTEGPGGNVSILAGDGAGAGVGGGYTLSSGAGGATGHGGVFIMTAGNGGATSGVGGDFSAKAGVGIDAGGSFTLEAGSSPSGPGGNFFLNAGGGAVSGGNMVFQLGPGGTNGTFVIVNASGGMRQTLDFESLSRDRTFVFPDADLDLNAAFTGNFTVLTALPSTFATVTVQNGIVVSVV